MKKIALAVFTLGLSACANQPQVVADWTTYPRDEVKEVSKRVSLVPNASLPPNVFTTEYKTTKIGDDAEIEGYVLPRSGAEFSEAHLLSRVAENGKKLCKEDFRVVETHYFYGKEATLKFFRIETPALRVKYRCT